MYVKCVNEEIFGESNVLRRLCPPCYMHVCQDMTKNVRERELGLTVSQIRAVFDLGDAV